MIFKAALYNRECMEYGCATIPFPIPRSEYEKTMEMLRGLDIGDAIKQDCTVDEISGKLPALAVLEGQSVNADELDYLAKRLAPLTEEETQAFQAMTLKYQFGDISDLINLTFSLDRVTVMSDFEDLDSLGRKYMLAQNGGCMTRSELEKIDGKASCCPAARVRSRRMASCSMRVLRCPRFTSVGYSRCLRRAVRRCVP